MHSRKPPVSPLRKSEWQQERELLAQHKREAEAESRFVDALEARVATESPDIKHILTTGRIKSPPGPWDPTRTEAMDIRLRHRFALYLVLGESRTLERLRRVLAHALPGEYGDLTVEDLQQDAIKEDWHDRADAFDEMVAQGLCPDLVKLQSRIATRLTSARLDVQEQIDSMHRRLNDSMRAVVAADVQKLAKFVRTDDYLEDKQLPPRTVLPPDKLFPVAESLQRLDREIHGIAVGKAAATTNMVPVEERDALVDELSTLLRTLPEDVQKEHLARIEARLNSIAAGNTIGKGR